MRMSGKSHAPIMFTTDLALKMDPAYNKISKRFLENPKEFEMPSPRPGSSSPTATWDRSPVTSALKCQRKPLIWQDPLPAVDHELVNEQDIARSRRRSSPRVSHLATRLHRLGLGLHLPRQRQARRCQWARIRLAPQKDWAGEQPAQLAKVLAALEKIQADFNAAQSGGKKVSLADLIVLGGSAASKKPRRRPVTR
jgi:catalase-peroxidase